jgi:pyruvate dehydrogenase E2 component (dihydrolipoamide acetyltransferase)
MAQLLVMPRQGNTVESCLLAAWRVEEGQAVRADQAVCDVETDKATFEVQAGAEGVLLKRLHAEGDDVPVLAPIAVIGSAGEDWRAALDPGGARVPREMTASPPPPAHAGVPSPGPTPGEGRAPGAGERPRISPRARRLAREAAVDAAGLAGTGPEGRILARDVQHAIDGRSRAAAAVAAPTSAPRVEPVPPPADRGASAFTEAPLKGVRRIIADRMRSSLSSTAQLTLHGSAPAARLLALRSRFKASDPARGLRDVTLGDLVSYVVAQVVPRFPAINAHLVGGALRTFERLNLGFAVDTPRGLLVPVIRDAGALSLAALSAEARRLAAACSAGTISPDELTGATFTVSNLGALGVEAFTPVLNAPEVGILGVGAVVARPVLGPDGAVLGAEQRIGLSLTIDHQALDGAPAARILRSLAEAMGDVDLLPWSR